MSGRILMMLCVIFLSACGYSFQGTKKNPLREMGVQKIYINQFKNATYRPGIEQLFSTAMVREFQKSGIFTLVNSKESADAVLNGTVRAADSSIVSSKSVTIPGTTKNVDVGAQFSSNVICDVSMEDTDGRSIFSQTVGSSKIYPGAARAGDEGSTAALVNDSEQRLAIQFLASQMMASVYQRIIDIF